MAENTTTKRTRRPSDEVKATKIAGLQAKIAKKEQEIRELKQQIEELKRPKKISERERQAMLKDKVESGSLTEEEAYQLGWKG